MPYGRSRRRGIVPPQGRGTSRTGTSSCAGIRNPNARAQCEQMQQQMGDTGGPAPPTGPGRTDPRGGGLGQTRRMGGGRGFGGMRPPRRGGGFRY